MEDVWPEFNKSSSLRPNRAWAKRTIQLSTLRLQILPIPAAFLLCGSLLGVPPRASPHNLECHYRYKIETNSRH